MKLADEQRAQQRLERTNASSRNKETLTLLSDLSKLSTQADERWIRREADLDVTRYAAAFAMVGFCFVVLLITGTLAFLLASIPTGVLYLPLGIVNMMTVVWFSILMMGTPIEYIVVWDTAALILFIVSLFTLIGQSTVFLMSWLELIEVHVNPVIDPRVWLIRYLAATAGCASMTMSVTMTIVTFFARPDDTDVVYLNLPVSD
jgi:hypothetical protein